MVTGKDHQNPRRLLPYAPSKLLNPFMSSLPLAVQALFVVVGIVTLLTWVVMPVLVRILKPWLQARCIYRVHI